MRVPITIDRNAIKTYQIDENYLKNLSNRLKSADFSWDQNLPKPLNELCIETIAKNWAERPLMDEIILSIDKCLLMNLLPINLPLSLTVPLINEDIYWKRCYIERWPKSLPSDLPKIEVVEIVKVISKRSSIDTNNGDPSNGSVRSVSIVSKKVLESQKKKTWKEYFIEMHVKEYLENLRPEEYEAEETYVKKNFSWDILRIEKQDISLLAKGLEKLRLKVFRIKNSEIDAEKCIILLKALLKHENLEVLEFSHCRISDKGVTGISKFSLSNPVKIINVTNNYIGPRGVEALCYALCKPSCNITEINLRLNKITDEGGDFLLRALMKGARKLRNLNLTGCGLNKKNIDFGDMIEHNSFLDNLNLSNNKLGTEIGDRILSGISYNVTLTNLDVRMCEITPETEIKILEKVAENRSKVLKHAATPIIREPEVDFQITDGLVAEIESILN